MKTPSAYYKFYDEICSRKDYSSEVKLILDVFRKYFDNNPRKILDVGCGTGSHAFEFSKMNIKVVGVDTDWSMIKIAKAKALNGNILNPRFVCGGVNNVKERKFDLAVSLFNVINYINNASDLLYFFRQIGKRLKNGKPFIFDSWNGIAAIIDPPRKKKTSLVVNGKKINITTKPTELNLFKQKVFISNLVVVKEGRRTDKFQFGYDLTLWTPNQLNDLLEPAGFKILSISPKDRPNIKADQNTWKIMFVCQKKK